MIQYISAAGIVQNLVLRFAAPTALDDRARWREMLAELPTAQPNAATASQQQQEIRVKAEPGTEAAAASAAAVTSTAAAPARPPIAPPAAASAAAPAATSGAKRSHAQFASPASAAAAANPAAVAASSSHATASAAPSGVLSSADLQSLLQSRAALLARDPVLNQLHSELVPAALSSDEFWASRERAELLRDEQLRLNLPLVSSSGAVLTAQRAGISSAMAGAVKADTAGGVNTVRYTLDASAIRAIFLENPMVHELFQQLVPTQLSEREFWTKYFRSQYVHSQQAAGGSQNLAAAQTKPGASASGPTVDDLFAKAKAAQEARDNESLGLHSAASQLHNASAESAQQILAEQAARRDVQTKATILARGIDPSVDLTAADMTDAILQADPSKTSGSAAPPSNTTRSRKAKAQTELVQKYNRHGMLVLDNTLQAGGAAPRNASAAAASAVSSGSSLGVAEQKLQSEYHAGLSSSLELVDLSRETEPVYNQLPIDAGRGFFFAAGGGSNGNGNGVKKMEEDASVAIDAARLFHSEVSAWPSASPSAATTHSAHHVPESSSSLSLLLQLTATARGLNKAAIAAKALRESSSGSGSTGGSAPAPQLVVFSTTGDEADMPIPDQFRDELRKRYHICGELFRHFWSSLNPRSSAKLKRIVASLEEQTALLQRIRDSLNVRSFSQLVPLLMPMLAQIEKCLTTYAAWEEKESKRIAAQQQGRRAQTPMQTLPNSNAVAAPMSQHNNAQAAESFAKRPRT